MSKYASTNRIIINCNLKLKTSNPQKHEGAVYIKQHKPVEHHHTIVTIMNSEGNKVKPGIPYSRQISKINRP